MSAATYFGKALMAAQEAGEEAGRVGLILPELEELIGGILAFAIVFFFMWKWAFPAINRMLEARQQAITGQLEQAESSRREAESLLEDYRQQLANAREEANRIIEEARRTAESLRQDMTAKAEEDAEEIVGRAREEVVAERERAMQQLRAQMAELSLDLAEKVVQKSIDREAQQDLVDRYLRELEEMAT